MVSDFSTNIFHEIFATLQNDIIISYDILIDIYDLDSFSLFRYAQFLEKCGDLETAEDYYLMALEADPNNAGCLHCYGNFLSERGLEEEAESFYLRSSKNTIGQKYMPEYYY